MDTETKPNDSFVTKWLEQRSAEAVLDSEILNLIARCYDKHRGLQEEKLLQGLIKLSDLQEGKNEAD
jgi:hypothetical protein